MASSLGAMGGRATSSSATMSNRSHTDRWSPRATQPLATVVDDGLPSLPDDGLPPLPEAPSTLVASSKSTTAKMFKAERDAAGKGLPSSPTSPARSSSKRPTSPSSAQQQQQRQQQQQQPPQLHRPSNEVPGKSDSGSPSGSPSLSPGMAGGAPKKQSDNGSRQSNRGDMEGAEEDEDEDEDEEEEDDADGVDEEDEDEDEDAYNQLMATEAEGLIATAAFGAPVSAHSGPTSLSMTSKAESSDAAWRGDSADYATSLSLLQADSLDYGFGAGTGNGGTGGSSYNGHAMVASRSPLMAPPPALPRRRQPVVSTNDDDEKEHDEVLIPPSQPQIRHTQGSADLFTEKKASRKNPLWEMDGDGEDVEAAFKSSMLHEALEQQLVMPKASSSLGCRAAPAGALKCLGEAVNAVDAETELPVTDSDLTMVHIQSWEQKLDWRSFLSESVAVCKARQIFRLFDVEAEPPTFLRPPPSSRKRPSQGLVERCRRPVVPAYEDWHHTGL